MPTQQEFAEYYYNHQSDPDAEYLAGVLALSPVAFYDTSLSPMWQDSARTIPASTAADVIGAWDDLSGNSYHVTQGTTANKPTLRTNVQNGRSVIRFDGGDSLKKTSFADFGDNYTVFMVMKMASGDSTQGVFEVSNGTFDTGFYMLHNVGNSTEWRGKGSGSVQLTDFTSPDIKDGVCRLHSMSNSGTLLQYWLNGTSKDTSVYTGPNANTLNQLDIGKINTGAYDLAAGGEIAALIIFNSTLSAGNRQSIEAILNERYAIY
jgi:hypothetical protein